jgi:hypothetical protein
MPVKISIEADNLEVVQAMLIGMTRALAEETGPAVLSDQAPSDIVQHPELPFSKGIEAWVEEAPDPLPEAVPEPVVEAAPEPKKPRTKRSLADGRKPKIALVEDIEPPPEVLTEEDEAEAEGAVDAPEPEPEPAGLTEQQMRDKVRDLMDVEGIPATKVLLRKAGYTQVKDVPPEDRSRVYAILCGTA